MQLTIKFWQNRQQFPTKDEMIVEKNQYEELLKQRGIRKHHFHAMAGDLQDQYYDALATVAKINKVPPVVLKIYNDRKDRAKVHLNKYRGDQYKIVDNNHFNVKYSNAKIF